MSALVLLPVMYIEKLLDVSAASVKIESKASFTISIFAVIAWANGLKLMVSLRCLTNDSK